MDTSCMNSSWLSLLTPLFGICIEIVNVLPWICHVWTLHDCRFWLYCLGFVLKLWMSCHGYVMYELFMIVAFDSIVWALYWNCECLAMDMSCMNFSWLSLLTLLFGICIEIVNVLPWICHVWTLHDCRFWLYCLGFVLKLRMSYLSALLQFLGSRMNNFDFKFFF